MKNPIDNPEPGVLAVAQAIIGPYDETVIGWAALYELRNVRWDRLTASDKSIALWQARAVLKTQQERAVACCAPVTDREVARSQRP